MGFVFVLSLYIAANVDASEGNYNKVGC